MDSLETRVPPPIVGLVIAVVMWALNGIVPRPGFGIGSALGSIAALLIALAGIVVLVPAVAAFRRVGTTINPLNVTQASSLVTTGIYAYTRNPMYLGMALVLLAWAIWLGSLIAFAGPLIFVVWITRFQILPEERAVAAKFGAEFAAYRAVTRRWI